MVTPNSHVLKDGGSFVLDLSGAEAKFKDAHQRGPHWADPYKLGAMCS
jgi:hypothetical protein